MREHVFVCIRADARYLDDRDTKWEVIRVTALRLIRIIMMLRGMHINRKIHNGGYWRDVTLRIIWLDLYVFAFERARLLLIISCFVYSRLNIVKNLMSFKLLLFNFSISKLFAIDFSRLLRLISPYHFDQWLRNNTILNLINRFFVLLYLFNTGIDIFVIGKKLIVDCGKKKIFHRK